MNSTDKHGVFFGGLIPGCLAVLLGGAAVWVADSSPIPGVNTLYRRPAWQSTKASLAFPPMGSLSFVVTDVTLGDGALDLGAWHGYQEVLVRRPLDPARNSHQPPVARLRFTLAVRANGVAHVLFDRTDSGFCGLRLSRLASSPSMFFCADALGRFVRKQPLSSKPHLSETVEVVLRFDEKQVRARVRELRLAPFARAPADSARQIGFRGGAGSALVDNVEVFDARGNLLFYEDFSPPRRGYRLAAAAGVGALVLALAVGWRHRRRRFVLWLVCVALALWLLTVTAVRLGLLARTTAYPDDPEMVDWSGLTLPDKSWSSVMRAISASAPAHKPPGQVRLLVLGGSQAWGEGASAPRNRYVDRLCARLRRDRTLWSSDDLRCINAGLPGASVRALHEFCDTHCPSLQADLTLLVVGVNDRDDPAAFVEDLELFWSRQVRRSRRLVLVAEPMAYDHPGLLRTHRTLRQFAARHGLPFVNAHAHLQRHREDGFLWWDPYHLSDLGHRIMARHLARRIAAYAPTWTSKASSGKGAD